MGSAITEPAIEMPEDVTGLPVHRVSVSIAKNVGDEVHILKGENLFGSIQWTHVEIWKIKDIIRAANTAYEMAQQSLGDAGMRELHHAH